MLARKLGLRNVVGSTRRDVLIPLAINIVSSAISAVLFTEDRILAFFVLFLLLSTVGMLVYFCINRLFLAELSKVEIDQIYPFREGDRPADTIPVNNRLELVHKRFLFMGVSAKSLWDSDLFAMMASNSYRDCTFRFLILDPQGDALERRIQSEGGDLDSAKHDIYSFVQDLAGILSSAPKMNIEVRYYDFVPPFWLTVCDDMIFVQTFPRGTIGRNSPLLVLKKGNVKARGFYEAFDIMIEETWTHKSRKVVLSY